MRTKLFALFTLLMFGFTSCEDISDLFPEGNTAKALKEALTLGANYAAQSLGQKDGYLGDPAMRISLPDEAQTALKAIETIQQLQNIPVVGDIITQAGLTLPNNFDDVLTTAINRAAENAAPQSVSIFTKAIKDMTINDAKEILFSGNDYAATDYLRTHTYTDLQDAFGQVINESLDTVKFGTYTANSAWKLFSDQNNNLAKEIEKPLIQTSINIANSIGLLSDENKNTINSIQPVATTLGNYVTGVALDRLFVKVGDEELNIRTNAEARSSKLLQDVFGQLDNQ